MPEQTESQEHLRIRRANVDSICIYEITEDELMAFENGSPGSLYLNFSLTLLSAAISFLGVLLSTTIQSNRVFVVFVVITVVGFLLGGICFIMWYINYRSSTSTAKRIRDRLKADSVAPAGGQDSVEPAQFPD